MYCLIEIWYVLVDGVGGGVGWCVVELGGGGQQNLQCLFVVQVWIVLYDQGQCVGGVGCGYRGIGFVGIVVVGYGVVDQVVGCGDVLVFGDVVVVVVLVVLLVEVGYGQLVVFQVWLEVGQGGVYVGVGVVVVVGVEDVDYVLVGDVGGGVQLGGVFVVLGIGGVQVVEGFVVDVFGLVVLIVVDCLYFGVGQCLVGGFEIVWVGCWVEQEVVVLVGVGDVYLCCVGYFVYVDVVV